MNSRSLIIVAVLAVVALVASNSFYVVSVKERAVLLRFGEAVQTDVEPGLHFKVPFVDNVVKMDARILSLDVPVESFQTRENIFLSVDYFVKWRIVDPGQFYRSTNGDERRAINLINNSANDGLRNAFGNSILPQLVSGRDRRVDSSNAPSPVAVAIGLVEQDDQANALLEDDVPSFDMRDQLMIDLTQALNQELQTSIGVEIIDIRIKAIDLPADVSRSVYERMVSEREREARDFITQGERDRTIAEAEADRYFVERTSAGFEQAETIRGQADARSASIYAQAYTQDEEFYSFTRSLRAYQDAFASGSDLLVLDPDDDFFRYLRSPTGNRASGAATSGN